MPRLITTIAKKTTAIHQPMCQSTALRHIKASKQLSASIHSDERKMLLARLLCHASSAWGEATGSPTVTMTLDRYSHVLPHMQDEVARAMGDMLDW